MTRCALLTLTPPTAAVPAGLASVAPDRFRAVSRTIVLAGLSVRRPIYEACRICPSGVQSENSTSATKRVSTHRSLPTARLDHRPVLDSPTANGVLATSSIASISLSSPASSELQPVPTLPTDSNPCDEYTPKSKLPIWGEPSLRPV